MRDREALKRPLPAPFDACDKQVTRVNSLSLVRYRTNDYSVPVAYGHQEVWIRGYVHEVVIGCGAGIGSRNPAWCTGLEGSSLWGLATTSWSWVRPRPVIGVSISVRAAKAEFSKTRPLQAAGNDSITPERACQCRVRSSGGSVREESDWTMSSRSRSAPG